MHEDPNLPNRKHKGPSKVLLYTLLALAVTVGGVFFAIKTGDTPSASAEPLPDNVVRILKPENGQVQNWKYEEVYRNDIKYGVYRNSVNGIYVINLTKEELEVHRLRLEILRLEEVSSK